jgi:hypothetical protein
MLSMELLPQSAIFAQNKFSKEQLYILEAGLFNLICEELKDYFAEEQKKYFRLLKTTIPKENEMIEESLARSVVKDIISSDMYTLSGIARYTYSTEDVLVDIVSGQNPDPSANLLTRIIKLHQTVRPDLYRDILKKLVSS